MENTEEKASIDFDVSTVPGGSCQINLNDAKGNEDFNKTRPDGGNDSFTGQFEGGKKKEIGLWN